MKKCFVMMIGFVVALSYSGAGFARTNQVDPFVGPVCERFKADVSVYNQCNTLMENDAAVSIVKGKQGLSTVDVANLDNEKICADLVQAVETIYGNDSDAKSSYYRYLIKPACQD